MKKARIIKVLQSMIYILPAVLCFSYFPVISLGVAETMNFELSLPLIWLAIFDVMSVIAVFKFKKTKVIAGKWWYYLFPFFATLSVFWSENKLRGALTLGVMWAVIIAIMAFAIMKREIFDARFKKNFWKWFFGASLLACAWCWVQCLLDIFGVTRDYTLMCLGCTYQSFGFPHPNGFAIEPQFMGNLLLAPALIGAEMFVVTKQSDKVLEWKHLCGIFFITSATLFLTFSRGAIYAFVVGLVFMSCRLVIKIKERKVIFKRIGLIWAVTVCSFLFTLNMQGLMAVISPTNEGYLGGISRVISQLSLGVINLNLEGSRGEDMVVEKPVENSVDSYVENFDRNVAERNNESTFDGYVPESTDTRVKLTSVALEKWQSSKTNMLFGVGIGGAGQSLYDAGLIDSPKEIVQNEYASLLLEVGIIGVLLIIVTAVTMCKWLWKKCGFQLVLPLIIAYFVTLFFFSGLPNALHIYLLPPLVYMVSDCCLKGMKKPLLSKG